MKRARLNNTNKESVIEVATLRFLAPITFPYWIPALSAHLFTGSFEVEVNGMQVFSKLARGSFPDFKEVCAALLRFAV